MPDADLLERSWQLEPIASSAGRARRHVRQLLDDAGQEQWVEAAELAVSEVVTNAVLHAHTAIRLTVRVAAGSLRVEVGDSNPALPWQRDYDAQATTGRGLSLLGAVTSTYGVDSLGPAGKVVWFCLGNGAPEPDAEELLAQWAEPDEPAPEQRTVVLVRLPATLWLAAREYHDAALRESVLYRAEHPEDPGSRADFALADEARAVVGTALASELDAAAERGALAVPLPAYHPGELPAVPGQLDLELRLTPRHSAAFSALQDAMDEAERLAESDRLLLRPGLPEIVAVRDWVCDQVVAQLAGAPPAPWVGANDERFTGSPDPDPLRGLVWDDRPVRASERGVVAADERNRIVAVSHPLAAALGWQVEQLVGRRVVTLVPHRFREAHVAGFSRHLTTGDARVLGVALELPVLRADGTEITCSFLIESDRSALGRAVYLAWITPIAT